VGRNILGIEQRTVVQVLVSRKASDLDEVSESGESEACASSPGRNIPGNKHRTGCEVIWQTAGDSDKGSWPEGQ
jgi:hypothetical protein